MGSNIDSNGLIHKVPKFQSFATQSFKLNNFSRPLWIPDSVKPNQDITILDQEKKKIKTGVDVRKVKTGVDVRKVKTGVDVKKIDQTVTG